MVVRRLSLYAAVAAACVFSVSCVNELFAQSEAAPDRAAGRMVDSLFEPNAPASFVPSAKAQLPPRRGIKRTSLQAKLVRNSNAKDGAPAFALVDKYGGILRYVEPVEKVNLEPYVGRVVGVRHDTGDTLLASQLIFPTGGRVASRPRSANGVQQAAFQEPIPAGQPEGETLLEPTPADEPEPATEGETYSFEEGQEVFMGEGGPIYQEEGLDFGGGCPNCESGTCSLHVGQGYRRGGAAAPRSRAYMHGEYLLWWFDGMDTPPLVTTSDANDQAILPNFPGEINQADGLPITTQTVYGQDPLLEDARHGFRILLGVWIDECNKQALEADYLFLGKLEEDFSITGVNGMRDGQEFWIGRPFFDLTPGTARPPYPIGLPREAAEDVSSADVNGTVSVYSSSEFQGAGLRLRHNLCRSCCPTIGCGDCVDCGMGVDCGLGVGCGSGIGCGTGVCGGGDSRFVDFVTGFRWYQLNEELQITEDLIIESENPLFPIPNGTTFDIIDYFSTENNFYGGELGFDWGIERNRWSLELLSKLGIGSTRQSATIWGSTVQTVPGVPPVTSNADEGILALSTNSGTFSRNRFSMIPEINLTAGYKLTQRCKLRVGYTLLYWTNVLRPGDQIDREINTTLIPGETASPNEVPRRPAFAFNETNVLIQGLNAGIEYNW